MGNTVARSHIRDADRGVARATRANTRKNSAPPPHTDPSVPLPVSIPVALAHPLFSPSPPLLEPPPSNDRARRVAFETSHSFTFASDHDLIQDHKQQQQQQQQDKQNQQQTATPTPPAQNTDTSVPDTPVLRALQTARVHTPPRVDKPPRARKVVSFNENVAVLTYPQEEGELIQDVKPTRRKGRYMFRLLQKNVPVPDADNAVWMSNCFTAQYDACCGLRMPDESFEDAYLKRSSIQHHREVADDRLSFSSSQDLYDEADMVVSFERAKHALKGEERREEVVDDFDYTERRSSVNEDTLSLSDAHPSRDAIDEPEAIGDQLLTVPDVAEELRNNSSFDIAPLWQRLKRVDELDGVRSTKRTAKLGRPRKDICRPCEDTFDINVDVDAPSEKLTKAIAADRVDDSVHLDNQIGPLLAERWTKPASRTRTEKRIRRSASVGSPSNKVVLSLADCEEDADADVVKSKSDLGRPCFAPHVVVSVLGEGEQKTIQPDAQPVNAPPDADVPEKMDKSVEEASSAPPPSLSDPGADVTTVPQVSTAALESIEDTLPEEIVSGTDDPSLRRRDSLSEGYRPTPQSTEEPAVPPVVMESPDTTEESREASNLDSHLDSNIEIAIPSSPVPWPSMPDSWQPQQVPEEDTEESPQIPRAVPEPVPTPTRSANIVADLASAELKAESKEEKKTASTPPRVVSDSAVLGTVIIPSEGATEPSVQSLRAPIMYTNRKDAEDDVLGHAYPDNASSTQQSTDTGRSASMFNLQESTIVPLKPASVPDAATADIGQISPVSVGVTSSQHAAASSSGTPRADSSPLPAASSAVSLEDVDSSAPKRPFLDEATAARLEAKMSGVTPSSLWKSTVALPSDGTSSDLISGEDFLLTLGSSNNSKRGEGSNTQGGGELNEVVTGLDLEALVLPGQDDFPSVPYSPSQAFTPLAGVYYGTSPPTTEPTSPDNASVSRTARRDYPEYEMLNGQLQDDSVAGSEPNTPILVTGSGWNEPFGDGMESRERVGTSVMQKETFEDRIPLSEVPEVLLHDWSGSTPIEPSVEIVDSAPNSRSSSSHLYSVIARPRVVRTEFPNAALLMSTRLSVDKSKLHTNRSDRADSAAFLPSQDEQGSSSSTAAVTKTGDFAGVVSSFTVGKSSKGGSEEKKGVESEERVSASLAAKNESSAAAAAWASSDNDGGADSEAGKKKFAVQPLPKVFPIDQKLNDFRQSNERKMFTETAYRRGEMTGRGMSFAEREMEVGRNEEPSSDFPTYASEANKRGESNRRRLAISPRRRRHSNLESVVERPHREDSNAFRGVVERLVSGMHLAKRLVTPN